jgi:hypothetical protein
LLSAKDEAGLDEAGDLVRNGRARMADAIGQFADGEL